MRHEGTLREMTADEFVRRLELCGGERDKRFAFFLGAGCSRSSGIPLAGELVTERWLPRLRDLKAPHRADLAAWAREMIPSYDPQRPAASYGDLIDKLFLTPEDRQREIESLCDGQSPGFGYAVLAQLVARQGGQFNVVLTTNFDDMVADALYLYSDARPLVIHHESLAAYIRPTRTRPLVVKLHGDHRLSPRNTRLETAELEEDIARHTAMLLHDRALVFIGYGGSDQSIHKLLRGLPPSALPHGVYWVDKRPPEGDIRAWLIERDGVWVKDVHFDELMLLVRNGFDLPHPDPGRFERIFADYHRTFRELSGAIEAAPPDAPGAASLIEAVKKTRQSLPERASRASVEPEITPPVESERRSTFDLPTITLAQITPDAQALSEQSYLHAIEADPTSAKALSDYAIFLAEIRRDHDRAEEFFRRALDVDAKHAKTLGRYAAFLAEVRKDNNRAEQMYLRALEADPEDAETLGRYALFFRKVRKQYDRAEALFRRALEADPTNAANLGNYARFLKDVRKDAERAEEMYQRAIEADPKSSINLGSYARFLRSVRKDDVRAERMFRRALEADPTDAYNLGSYARFLKTVRKDDDGAEQLYHRALEVDPDNAKNLGDYAVFLQFVRKDPARAEEMYQRAVTAAPKDAAKLSHYAGLLLAAGRGSEGLEVLERALRAIDATTHRGVQVECWFYVFVHGAPGRRRAALARVKRLVVDRGARAEEWDFSRNVERAMNDGHPEAAWLPQLCAVLNDAADPDSLDVWPAWSLF